MVLVCNYTHSQGSHYEEATVLRQSLRRSSLRHLVHGTSYYNTETGTWEKPGGGLLHSTPTALLLKLGVLTPFLETPRSMHVTAPQLQFAGYWAPRKLLPAVKPSHRDFEDAKVALRGRMQAVDYRPGGAISSDAISLEFYQHLWDDRKHPFITELDPQDDILGKI